MQMASLSMGGVMVCGCGCWCVVVVVVVVVVVAAQQSCHMLQVRDVKGTLLGDRIVSARPLYSRSLQYVEKKNNHKMQPEKQKQSLKSKKMKQKEAITNCSQKNNNNHKSKKHKHHCKQKWNNSAGRSGALLGRVHVLARFLARF